MNLSRSIRLVVISLILVCTTGCDQATKHLARTELGGAGSITMPGGFIELTLAENLGAFLSLGASFPQALRSGFAICVGLGLACLLAYIVRTPKMRLLSCIGFGLVCAGGVSNLVDRFLSAGLVTDFMVIKVGPIQTGVFNVADLAIVTGTLVVAASLIMHGHSHQKEVGDT